MAWVGDRARIMLYAPVAKEFLAYWREKVAFSAFISMVMAPYFFLLLIMVSFFDGEDTPAVEPVPVETTPVEPVAAPEAEAQA